MGVLEIATGHMVYVNAGHNPPLVRQAGGSFGYMKLRPGFVLAGMEGIRYKSGEMDLSPGSTSIQTVSPRPPTGRMNSTVKNGFCLCLPLMRMLRRKNFFLL